MKIARISTALVSETSHKQNHCQDHKATLNEKPNDSQH